MGPWTSIHVMPGDTVRMSVYAKYDRPTKTKEAISGMAGIIAGAITGGAGNVEGIQQISRSIGETLKGGQAALLAKNNNVPKAYLNYIFFDKEMKSKETNFKQVTEAAHGSFEELEMEFIAKEEGYLMTYTANETNEDLNVFMDDMTVTHTTGPIVRVDDYYPFGLTFNTSERENSLSNKYLFNGKEREELTDWYDYGARMYMADIGRWGVIDVLSNAYYSYSPYNYVLNNPTLFLDKEGKFKIPIHYKITATALNNLGLKAKFFRLDILSGNTVIADIFGADEDYHFDGRENFTEIKKTWKELNQKISEADIGDLKFGGASSQNFGILLHNIQDFYAHSNYVELFIEYYHDKFGGIPSTAEIPTFDEVSGNPGYDDFAINYLIPNLRTGEFDLTRYLIKRTDIEETNKEGNVHHDQLAKDDNEESGLKSYNGISFHEFAVQVAIRHTTQVLKEKTEKKDTGKGFR